jgi:hypothetical protein
MLEDKTAFVTTWMNGIEVCAVNLQVAFECYLFHSDFKPDYGKWGEKKP